MPISEGAPDRSPISFSSRPQQGTANDSMLPGAEAWDDGSRPAPTASHGPEDGTGAGPPRQYPALGAHHRDPSPGASRILVRLRPGLVILALGRDPLPQDILLHLRNKALQVGLVPARPKLVSSPSQAKGPCRFRRRAIEFKRGSRLGKSTNLPTRVTVFRDLPHRG